MGLSLPFLFLIILISPACSPLPTAVNTPTPITNAGSADVELVRLDEPPAGEAVATSPSLDNIIGFEANKGLVTVDARTIELTMPEQGETFLVAHEGGQMLWSIDEYPAAGGSEVIIFGRKDRRLVFLSQSRIGTWALDVLTGHTWNGYDAPVLSPDGRRALMVPYFNPFTACFASAGFAWLNLDEGSLRNVPGIEVPKVLQCADSATFEGSNTPWVAAAISPDGNLYLAAFAEMSDDGKGLQGRVELLRTSDDKRLATLAVNIPNSALIDFSASGKHIVLSYLTDDGSKVSTWYRIDGALR